MNKSCITTVFSKIRNVTSVTKRDANDSEERHFRQNARHFVRYDMSLGYESSDTCGIGLYFDLFYIIQFFI